MLSNMCCLNVGQLYGENMINCGAGAGTNSPLIVGPRPKIAWESPASSSGSPGWDQKSAESAGILWELIQDLHDITIYI